MGLIFTYGMTCGGSLLALWRPFYGLLVYVCFALIKPEATWWWSVPPGNYSRIIAISLLIGWAINGFGGFQFANVRWIVGALVAYFVWICLSTIQSPEPQLGYRFAEAQFKIILPVIVGASVIKTRHELVLLAWTITLSMGYLAFLLNEYYFQGNNILARDGFGSMDNNSFAIKLVTAVGLAFYLGLGSKNLLSKAVAFFCSALIVHAVFFSFSRGGMLALCVAGVVSFWLLPKRPVQLALFALGVVLASMMAGDQVVERFASTFADERRLDESAQSRLVMWEACIHLMAENPLFGIGPDRFNVIGHNYHPYEEGKEAHTLWLTLGAELGVPGLVFILSFYLLTAFTLYRHLRSIKYADNCEPFDRCLPPMVISSLAGFLVAAQFVSLERLEIPFYVTLLGVAALKVYAAQRAESAYQQGVIVWVPEHHPGYSTAAVQQSANGTAHL